MINNILLVYFSGTGGTERVADSFESELGKRGATVTKVNLDRSKPERWEPVGQLPKKYDMLMLVYPVYAFDAPIIVYDWLGKVTADRMKTAVISVSGGGEAWPNTGCRASLVRTLESKGFEIVYEKMMVMPANCITQMNAKLSMLLINVVPEKVSKILDSILAGNTRRTSFFCGPVKRFMADSSKKGFNRFAKGMSISEECTGCGWCSRNCPVGNVSMNTFPADSARKRPEFGNRCIMCLRCIYGCPSKALSTNVRLVFKSGFRLEEIEQEIKDVPLEPVEKLAKGPAWVGVRKYLLDKDGY